MQTGQQQCVAFRQLNAALWEVFWMPSQQSKGGGRGCYHLLLDCPIPLRVMGHRAVVKSIIGTKTRVSTYSLNVCAAHTACIVTFFPLFGA